MAFREPPSSYPFLEGFVRTKVPNASGVYILFSTPGFAWEIIHVGDAENLQKRLLELLNGDNPCVAKKQPTSFIFELADAERRAGRRDELIGEYDPTCNR